jgi:2,4-dienoyl-CoA reductase (NADPH2)
VIVVDELGFHQATSAAELLADRGCRVEVITNGMVVGQDLGVTLDLETWNVKAHAKGIRQRTDVVVLGSREEDGRLVLSVQHHPTGTGLELACDWAACAVPAQPEDTLWRDLRDSGAEAGGVAGGSVPFEVHRVGDCLAPRRAHAAVIEGERVGAAL